MKMNDKEILENVIEKALDNGWSWKLMHGNRYSGNWKVEYAKHDKEILCIEMDDYIFETKIYYPIISFIFSHDFAKAFFGTSRDGEDEWYCDSHHPCDEPEILNMWQYHLTQMVLEPKPLKYLEKYL